MRTLENIRRFGAARRASRTTCRPPCNLRWVTSSGRRFRIIAKLPLQVGQRRLKKEVAVHIAVIDRQHCLRVVSNLDNFTRSTPASTEPKDTNSQRLIPGRVRPTLPARSLISLMSRHVGPGIERYQLNRAARLPRQLQRRSDCYQHVPQSRNEAMVSRARRTGLASPRSWDIT
jgi:hypothetical protein